MELREFSQSAGAYSPAMLEDTAAGSLIESARTETPHSTARVQLHRGPCVQQNQNNSNYLAPTLPRSFTDHAKLPRFLTRTFSRITSRKI